MQRLLMDPDLAGALRALGVRSARDLMRLGPEPTDQSVRARIELSVPGSIGIFHLKRYVYRGWRESRHLLGRGTLFGTAPELREYAALQWLRAHGLGAVRPVAAAALSRAGRLQGHVLLTEHVPDALDLAACLADPHSRLRRDKARLQQVLEALGRSLRAMHLLGFTHRDCHLRNVLVRSSHPGPPALWWLDCRRGGVGGWRRGPEYDLALMRADLAAAVGGEGLAHFEEAYGLLQPDRGRVRPG